MIGLLRTLRKSPDQLFAALQVSVPTPDGGTSTFNSESAVDARRLILGSAHRADQLGVLSPDVKMNGIHSFELIG
jgi:hypothetical protein